MFHSHFSPSGATPLASGERARLRPGALAATAFCLAHLALWGTAFALAFATPRLDGAEQLVWAYSLEGGYWKHPPLPSWIMHALVHAFGPSAALTYVAGQACIAAALGIAWRLGCEFMDWRRSLAALALTSLLIFYNAGGDAFNHEVALLPLVAATALLFLRAVRTGRWTLWCLTGLAAGLALLTKYSALLHFAALLAWFAVSGRRSARNLAGIGLAAAIALAVTAPHGLWLVHNDFVPFRYARTMVEAHKDDRLAGMAEFLGVLVARALPLLAVAWFALRRAPGEQVPAAAAGGAPDRLFLWMVGGLPLALTVAFGFVTSTNPPARWATCGLLLSGWLVMDAWSGDMSRARLRRTLAAAAVVQLTLCVAATVVGPHVSAALHSPGRSNFPARELAESARATWAAHASTPLRVVVSDTWVGGNLVAQWREVPPAVLLEGEPRKAPWVPPDAVRRCGALVMVDFSPDAGADPAVADALLAYLDQAGPHGEWNLPWPGDVERPDSPSRAWIVWGVIAPQPGASCPL